VISAFGSDLTDETVKAALGNGVQLDRWGLPSCDAETQRTSAPDVWVAGDLAGVSQTTVEAVNDGKTAAWDMHKYLQASAGAEGEAVDHAAGLPGFFTEIDKVDLSYDIAGMRFPNPFGLASAPPTGTSALIRRAYENGWGFNVTKTYGLDKDICTNVSPRIVRSPSDKGAFLNIELISEKTEAYWVESIKELKRDFPDQPLIASVMASFNEEDWKALIKGAVEAGADGIEMNLSCPHGMGEKGMGLACGQNEDMVEQICIWAKEAAPNTPVFAKLTPNVTDVVDIASAAQRGGADGVTAVNTVSALMGVRADGTAWPNVGSEARTTYGGYSGTAVRPIALRAVSAIARALPGFPILATGGISSAEIGLEFIMAGAHAVQVCSAVQEEDSSIVQDYISGLKALMYVNAREDLREAGWRGQYLEHAPAHQGGKAVTREDSVTKDLPNFGPYVHERRKRRRAQLNAAPLIPEAEHARIHAQRPVPDFDSSTVANVSDLIAMATPSIGAWHELSQTEHVIAKIDADMCVNCGRCFKTCNDSGYQAITFTDDTHIAKIVDKDCTGCTLCLDVCPINDCITMVPRDGPYIPDRGVPLGGTAEATMREVYA
jgi:dihydropyrimidine dehydrogenase (NADP+)